MKIFARNKTFVLLTVLIISIYSSIAIVGLPYGTPNITHPFNYNMDEWHQLMAVKAIAKQGTTTISGSAEIPFVYPVLSSIYLIPFILLHIINPFTIKTSIGDLVQQQHLFEILRSVNIFFGAGSIILVGIIAKKYLKSNFFITIFLFTFSPILLSLTDYFKYDVGLLFFITLSLYTLFRFGERQTLRRYMLAAFACGVALGTKFSAIPLLPLLLFSYFWFMRGKKKDYRWIMIGILVYVLAFLVFGSPDLIYGKADYSDLLTSNLVAAPAQTNNFILPYVWWIYFPLKQYPILFGHSAYFLAIGGFIFLIINLYKKGSWKKDENKYAVFLLASFTLFALSLIPLQIGAIGNRLLVLLPFLSLITSLSLTLFYKYLHGISIKILICVICILFILQLCESMVWMDVKYTSNPQKDASIWIEKNITKGTTIDIENIPIYQFLPDNVLNDFYDKQYGMKKDYQYRYNVVSYTTEKLDSIVIVTDDVIDQELFRTSTKNSLVERLEKEKYKRIAVFSPNPLYHITFANDRDYYFAGLDPSPLTITVYKK